ncbi:MAG: NERD domain-containing protein [Nitrospinota bacterium]|nr:NERD domain-containing protein [Nitrospinota bacterium]
MARMIPPTIDHDTTSNGEIEIFRKLKKDKHSDNWIVLHSLDLAQHVKMGTGEMDFVIIIPNRGILCLEVKGFNRFIVRDGRWKFGADRHWSTRSPFAQSKEAKFSLLHWLQKSSRPDLANLFIWHAVIFPFAIFRNKNSPEWNEWEVIDKTMYLREPLTKLLENVLQKAWGHFKRKKDSEWCRLPNEQECIDVANTLRPRFEFFLSPKEEMKISDEEVKNYTEEQFAALDALEYNDRVLFDGASGTGKTLLAIEIARRAAAKGVRMLLVCHSRLLGEMLENETRMLAPWVTAGAFREINVRNNSDSKYDLVIIDEAQDVFNHLDALEYIDSNLNGGIKEGRWRVFIDTASGDFGNEAKIGELNRYTNNYTRYALKTNCRNSSEIASFAASMKSGHTLYSEIKRKNSDAKPEIIFYPDKEAEIIKLKEYMENLLNSGVPPEDIIILSAKKVKDSAPFALSREEKWKSVFIQQISNSTEEGKTGYCSIWDFKGLEKRAVILTDIDVPLDADLRNLLYIGASRALHKLTLFASDINRKDFERLLPASDKASV